MRFALVDQLSSAPIQRPLNSNGRRMRQRRSSPTGASGVSFAAPVLPFGMSHFSPPRSTSVWQPVPRPIAYINTMSYCSGLMPGSALREMGLPMNSLRPAR